MSASLGDICAVACAEAFRGDGHHMISPMAPIPKLGARLAKSTFSPDIVLTDGANVVVDIDGTPIGWMPFSRVFDTLWAGRRHVMMGATQIDQFGNQNISCLGDFAKPKVQLLGSRGAPGNTICHPTSYWIQNHSSKVFVPEVDMVSGLGTNHGAFEIRRVVSNLGVFDFTSADGRMQLLSLHPGVSVDEVVAATGFAVHIPDDVPVTRSPTAEEQAILDRLDPTGRVRGALEA